MSRVNRALPKRAETSHGISEPEPFGARVLAQLWLDPESLLVEVERELVHFQ